MESIEMQFEYVIRRAHHCGRYGAAGADADLYRGFMGCYFTMNESITNKNPNAIQAAIEYGIRLGKVRMSLDIASKKVIAKIEDTKHTDAERIEEIREKIHSTDEPKKMAEAVTELDQLFLKLGLFPG